MNVIFKTNGNLFIGSGHGVIKSVDDGRNWKYLNTGLPQPQSDIISFTILGNYLFAGGGNSIYRMPLSDSIWENVTHGLQSGNNTIVCNGSRLFVAGTGVFLSKDSGATWEKKNNQTPFKAISINGALIFAAHNNTGVYSSIDSGETWIPPKQPLPYVAALVSTTHYIFAGTSGGGVFVSYDTAKTWAPLNNELPCFDISALAIDDSLLYAGTIGSSVFVLNVGSLSAGMINPKRNWRNLTDDRPKIKFISTNNVLINYYIIGEGITEIDIYDVLGHRVKHLFRGWQPAGNHHKRFSTKGLARNKYVVSIMNNGRTSSIPLNY
jgi:hypothetical protein